MPAIASLAEAAGRDRDRCPSPIRPGDPARTAAAALAPLPARRGDPAGERDGRRGALLPLRRATRVPVHERVAGGRPGRLPARRRDAACEPERAARPDRQSRQGDDRLPRPQAVAAAPRGFRAELPGHSCRRRGHRTPTQHRPVARRRPRRRTDHRAVGAACLAAAVGEQHRRHPGPGGLRHRRRVRLRDERDREPARHGRHRLHRSQRLRRRHRLDRSRSAPAGRGRRGRTHAGRADGRTQRRDPGRGPGDEHEHAARPGRLRRDEDRVGRCGRRVLHVPVPARRGRIGRRPRRRRPGPARPQPDHRGPVRRQATRGPGGPALRISRARGHPFGGGLS
jgi:hypothetical protein